MRKFLIVAGALLASSLASFAGQGHFGFGFVSGAVATGGTTPAGTSLLMHYDGNTLDSSGSPKTVTATGATTTTTNPKFGSGSAIFSGSNQHFTVPQSTDFQFGTGDFTIAFWLNVSTTSGAYSVVSNDGNSADDTDQYLLFLNGSSFQFYSGSSPVSGPSGTFPRDGAWHHVALTKAGTSIRLFVDGSQIGTTGTSGNTFGKVTSTYGFWIGGNGTFGMTGQIDEMLVVKGTAIWTSNFTPPTAAYN